MGECVLCLKQTDNLVADNIGGKSYLCIDCQDKFEKCKECGEYYLKEEMKDGLCPNCI